MKEASKLMLVYIFLYLVGVLLVFLCGFMFKEWKPFWIMIILFVVFTIHQIGTYMIVSPFIKHIDRLEKKLSENMIDLDEEEE